MPTLAQFQGGIYISGSYAGAAANAPVLRDAAGQILDLNNAPPGGTHYSVSYVAGGAPSAATTPRQATGAPVAEPNSGGQRVPFVPPGGAGNAIYLPFVANQICSAILPADPASNVDYFYTDNLSGCAIYIDQIVGTNDLIVYHANRMTLTALQNLVPAVPPGTTIAQYLANTLFANQYQNARDTMRGDRVNARAELAAAMPPGTVINPVAQLERATYFLPVENEMARKRAMGRTNVDIGVAGTNVMGFRVAGNWQFWWQTWTILTFDRPWNAPKRLTHGTHQDVVLGTGRLLATQQFL